MKTHWESLGTIYRFFWTKKIFITIIENEFKNRTKDGPADYLFNIKEMKKINNFRMMITKKEFL
ncbi:MAG: hypothetical protein HeimC3_08380 [Candidatus Heimdallarchaeota archaeon LC_3]|nr:MAG: hypothetical protein HeimC3_08380 [Candidatus Heimdallarchaeota archaeon LC_3]